MSNIRSEPYWSGDHSEEYLSDLDVFARLMYAENCAERRAHGEKEYSSFIEYVEQQADFIQTKFDMECCDSDGQLITDMPGVSQENKSILLDAFKS